MRGLAKIVVVAAVPMMLMPAADAVVPEQWAPITVAQAAPSDKNAVGVKRRHPSRLRSRLRYRPVTTTFPGVIPPRQEMVMPNPNFPPYNSGTVVRVPRPARDPIVPGVGIVPQLPPIHTPESYGDRVVRCIQQSAIGNVPADQRAMYEHRCSIGR